MLLRRIKLLSLFLAPLLVLYAVNVDGRQSPPRKNDASPQERKLRTQYNRLNPNSIPQQLAFYELYQHTPEGQRALRQAYNLLAGIDSKESREIPTLTISPSTITAIVDLVNKQPNGTTPTLTNNEHVAIQKLAQRLPNRRLKGFSVVTEAEAIALPPHEIDLARALFLSQVGDDEAALKQIYSYESMIDLMALQILSQLPQNGTPRQKIRAINHLIFYEMGFRFPPHSLFAKDVDTYTFLPSVLDSRHGVCLGVSVLYLCLAQRLDLPLEIITPPGHIYIRYRNGDEVINIETTARGVHIDSEEYLGIDTCSLEERDIKEVVGLTHINHASAYWHEEKYNEGLASFKKALPYLPDDMLLKELTGYNYLFLGEKEKGTTLLRQVKGYTSPHSVTPHALIEDYLSGAVDAEGIKTIFLPVDETRDSILRKKETLEGIVSKHPRFRDGVQALATTWLQLHREKEALKWLEAYHALDPNESTAEYYLAALYADRLNYTMAWKHLKNAERIVEAKNHHPKALKSLRKQLSRLYPE